MATAPNLDALAELDLFRGLTSEQWARLSALLRRKSVPAGTRIVAEEEHGEGAYVVMSGTVKIVVEQEDGSDVILAILGPGSIVGEMSLIDDDARSATAIALEASVLAWIGREGFRSCLQTMPALSGNLIRMLTRRLRLADAQIQSLSTLDVPGRVARQILAFAETYGKRETNGDILIDLRLPQGDLADMVGASRVRVNQAMMAYKRRCYISTDRQQRIVVHDMAALAQRCQ